jgi:hypothetical protein
LAIVGQAAFQPTRRRIAITTLGGIAVAAGIILVIGVVRTAKPE